MLVLCLHLVGVLEDVLGVLGRDDGLADGVVGGGEPVDGGAAEAAAAEGHAGDLESKVLVVSQ